MIFSYELLCFGGRRLVACAFYARTTSLREREKVNNFIVTVFNHSLVYQNLACHKCFIYYYLFRNIIK
jgi:hypothetical protein